MTQYRTPVKTFYSGKQKVHVSELKESGWTKQLLRNFVLPAGDLMNNLVWQVLRQADGALELMDVADRLPELRRCQGLEQWTVKGSKGEYFDTLEAAEQVASYSLKPVFLQEGQMTTLSWGNFSSDAVHVKQAPCNPCGGSDVKTEGRVRSGPVDSGLKSKTWAPKQREAEGKDLRM